MRRAAAALVLAVVLVAGGGLAEAAFTTHESNEQSFTAGDIPVPADLVAQSRSNDGGAANSQIQYGLNLTNGGTTQLDLDTVTIRYWFTEDGSPGEPQTACYYATFGCGQLRQSVVDLVELRDDADHYVEVGFTQGRLGPGESASLDQLAISDPSGATFTQSNDYSFLAKGSFTDNPRVTVYLGDQLVWGTEPEALPKVESLEVQYANFDSDPQDNAIKPGLKLRNTGTVPVDLSRIKLRYWFTAEPPKPMQGFCDYAEVGCPKISVGFGDVQPARPGADTYLEVSFSGGTLQVGGSTGQIQLRIHGANYGLFDERDDYSRGTNTSFASTMKVAAYLDGNLVWGTPP